jgi:predicted TIM-barrel fold metal-dependent hydrolase
VTAPNRIDTHSHIVPPDYGAWLRRRGADAGGLLIPDWSVDAALDAMEARKVRTSIVSVSTPGVHFGDDREARDMARAVNEYAASVARRHPDRFGFFATLTLPDVEGALAELAYAFDTLKADGVILLANTHGEYLGAPSQAPLFDELNRRRAVVFIHPAQLPGPTAPDVPPYAVDFLLDTTRAAIRLVKSGTLQRCPDINVILSHAGGFVPYAAHRIAVTTSPNDVSGGLAQLKRFYYDIALSSSPTALPSLLAFAAPDHVLFGSDWPHAPTAVGGLFESMYERYPLDEAQRASIDRGAAGRLFQRLAT